MPNPSAPQSRRVLTTKGNNAHNALAGMMKGQRRASEAALKYSIYGAGTAGVMLYGISLLAGLLNTAHLPTMTLRLVEQVPGMETGEIIVLALGSVMIMVGLAFKLANGDG